MTERCPVLVTGGAGYIGSHAVLALSDAGWPVIVIDDLSTGNPAVLPDGTPFYRGDIADGALLARIFADHGVGAIMHFAGSIVVPESVADPVRYFRNNTVASLELIAAAARAGVRHFIFSSTAAVYGAPEVVPIAEDALLRPINPYGQSKLFTELMLAEAARVHGFNAAVLRYFNVAGADPQGRSGQSGPLATHLIKIALQAATGKRDGVGVYGTDFATPDGTGVRDYVHVSDLADAHVLALEWLIDNPEASLTANCGYGRGFSVLEVLDAVDRVVGAPVSRRIEGRRAGDPDVLVADPGRLKATVPWRPCFADLETIIGHALAWEQRLEGGA